MTLLRTAVLMADGNGARWLEAACLAERLGITTFWIGDPAPDRADQFTGSYLAATAGAIFARTSALRVGLFMPVGDGPSPLRIAEDLAVLDNLSAGRVEYGPVVAPEDIGGTVALRNAWRGWPLPGGGTVHVIPHPVQPAIPCLLTCRPSPDDLARLPEAGLLIRAGSASPPSLPNGRRRVLLLDCPPLAATNVDIDVSRRLAEESGADEIIFSCDGSPEALTFIATAIAPALRASEPIF